MGAAIKNKQYDAIVIGGGPAGSTAATVIARRGHDVVLFEREAFPRHQIGESLLPSTVHGLCAFLGVDDELAAAGFVRKPGGTFLWGREKAPWTFRFGDGSRPWHSALHVERARFDHILLNNAERVGVDVCYRGMVRTPIREGERIVGVHWEDDAGEAHETRAKHVVDAAGSRSTFYRCVGQRIYSEHFRNLAMYCYFDGGKRLPPPDEDNILTTAFEKGWFWYIPLSTELTSVGVVVGPEWAPLLQGGQDAAMNTFIAGCPMIADYLASARRVTDGIYGKYRVRRDYSYCNTRFWRAGLTLVGDAACFVDPVFSSGVHLATYSALLAARSINSVLDGSLDEQEAFSEFECRYRDEYRIFYDFLLGFYDMEQDWDGYFWHARRVVNSKEAGNLAFLRIVSGGSTAPEDFLRMREGIGHAFANHVHRERRSSDQRSVTSLGSSENDRRVMAGFQARSVHSLLMLGEAGRIAAENGRATPRQLGVSADGCSWSRM